MPQLSHMSQPQTHISLNSLMKIASCLLTELFEELTYPDEEAGQIPMAYIVRKAGSSISGDHIMGFVAKQVAPYKKIRRVAFIDSIPKNLAGKLLRRLLVSHAVSGASDRL
ncbi:hypothetical protein Droror1_Dr00021419 [Drosera rotundifolia]